MITPILSVKNLQESKDFFMHVLGFKHDFTMQGGDGKDNFSWLSMGKSVQFGLSLHPEGPKGGDGVVFMIYIPDETDLDAYYAEVKAKHPQLAEEIRTEYWGDRLFSIRDSNGYMLSFCKTVQQLDMEKAAELHKQQ